MESRGKAIGIPLGDDWWVNVHLRMHGHTVVITAKELRLIDNARLEDPDSEMGKATIQLALINEDYEAKSIIVVDRLRLFLFTRVALAPLPEEGVRTPIGTRRVVLTRRRRSNHLASSRKTILSLRRRERESGKRGVPMMMTWLS